MMVKIINKYLLILGFIILVQDFKLKLVVQHLNLRTILDKSSLKVGDRFEILKRNEQSVVGGGTVGSIDVTF